MLRLDELEPDSPVEVRLKQVGRVFLAVGVAIEIIFIPPTIVFLITWLFDLS